MRKTGSYKLSLSDREWRERLDPKRYRVLRRKGTEPPFSGAYADTKQDGVYRCAGCGQALFASEAKFDSGTGWPSFFEPIDPIAVLEAVDRGQFVARTEILCSGCDGHLGHVFDDGPEPSGLRYCINSLSLKLDEGSSAGISRRE